MTTAALLAACFLAAPIPQTDRWVDPIHGSDQAFGTTPQTAWKTLTRAVTLVAPGTTIKVMPGVLDEAGGEDFPIEIPVWIEVESTGGPDVTEIDSPTYSALVLRRASRVQGFTIRSGANIGVFSLNWHGNPVPPLTRFYDNRVFAPNGDGVYAKGMDLRDCVIESDDRALTVTQWDVIARDCEFRGGAGHGCAIQLTYEVYAAATADFERCTFSSIDDCGVIISDWNPGEPLSYRFSNCLFADCARGGIEVSSTDDRDQRVVIEGCTIATGGQRGVSGYVIGNGSVDIELRSSIVAGHTALDVDWPVAASDSLIGDGSATGPGCLSGDPRFVAAANRDWRLRFDSPCKEIGLALGEGLDVTGRTRSVDGDLNLVGAPDMGAFEHVTLTAPESVLLGAPFDVGMTGPVNGFSFLVMDPNGLASSPLSTPYGRLRVYGPTAMRFPPIATTGGGPDTFTVPAFTDPAMVGSSAGLQALTRSTLAPAQAAFSNSAAVRVD